MAESEVEVIKMANPWCDGVLTPSLPPVLSLTPATLPQQVTQDQELVP